MFRDRTEAMFDQRGPEPGPGPVLTLTVNYERTNRRVFTPSSVTDNVTAVCKVFLVSALLSITQVLKPYNNNIDLHVRALLELSHHRKEAATKCCVHMSMCINGRRGLRFSVNMPARLPCVLTTFAHHERTYADSFMTCCPSRLFCTLFDARAHAYRHFVS